MISDTIVALSTPPGGSAIAVVRISGPRSAEFLCGMAPGAASWEPRTLHACALRDGSGETIDEAAAILLRAPHSYTGEDSAEIFCHGSMVIAERIICEAVRLGARPAGPGEFTRRAYLSGRIDLSQAEAVADLIAAETKLQAKVALEHLGGGLSRRLGDVEHDLLGMLTLVEAAIDFSGEGIEAYTDEKAADVARAARSRIDALLEAEVAGGKLRTGIRVAITGPRNAGKSSIYNALIGEERAIVSALPGTTRDVLRERIHIGGFTFFLEDTAGLGATECEIEERGIAKGSEAVQAADLIVFVVDAHAGWDDAAGEELEAIADRNHIIALNKRDLGTSEAALRAARAGEREKVVETSAVTGEGLDRLRELIYRHTAGGGWGDLARERIAVNARQGIALHRAEAALGRLEEEAVAGSPAEILSVELRDALDAIGEVTGRSAAGRVLDEIFSRFCVGK
ncbi:MAG: tRNA uridine-5-carboxymethylaminomethyl(34) synthesis GTPase MnmE [Candidatus Krumholzibacteria bacterium]|nr:tRNA uridine-5-carboxymethylaminomethyl(34) synthesis GTPase MnmE [Candidatus Krumholzibacteria bacterium]